jgi:hypothetical protein
MYLQTRGIFLYTNGDKEMRHAPENMCVHKTSLRTRQFHKGHWQGQVKYTEEETGKVEFLQYSSIILRIIGTIIRIENQHQNQTLIDSTLSADIEMNG